MVIDLMQQPIRSLVILVVVLCHEQQSHIVLHHVQQIRQISHQWSVRSL
jgi:hypothetical protein